MKEFAERLTPEDLLEWRTTVARYEALEFAGHTFSKEEAIDVARRWYEHAADLIALYVPELHDASDGRSVSIYADTGRIVLDDD